ncbi:MAG: FAD-dependent monooxygenase [Nitriliruptoraceae bacterium]|nr:FAD-dependent monooxygenase [Nitriliruptoraceae bacterium]
MGATRRLVIIGAGPVGVVAALDAARRGYEVTLVEAADEVDRNPRAATFHPSTLEMVARLGFFDAFVAAGLVARYFDFWDKPTMTRTARFDHQVLADDTPHPFVVQCEQHKLVEMGLQRMAGEDTFDVHLGTVVTAIDQRADGVTVSAEGPDGPVVFRGDFVLGCDGGRSTVRKAIDVEFEGFTWPERFIVLTSLQDMQAALDCSFRNYIADPDEWANLFKVAGEGGQPRWRAVFPTGVDQEDDDALSDAECARRLGALVPDAGLDALIHRKTYNVHQRVAASFREGRVFLAGDAAHVNNPIGGLGLNCGIHDAIELLDTLDELGPGPLDDHLLDRYERRRRSLIIEFVQKQTIANKKRLEASTDEERRAKRDELLATTEDPERHREFLLRSSLLASVRASKQIA